MLATEKKNKSILFEDHSTYKIEQVFVHCLSFEKRIYISHTHSRMFSADHWKHWYGVQRNGPRLQASHPQSQKDGTGWVKVLGNVLSVSSRTTTLCITRRSPRRSWCTEWHLLCRSTPSLAGYPASIMSSSWHHDFVHHVHHNFVHIIMSSLSIS